MISLPSILEVYSFIYSNTERAEHSRQEYFLKGGEHVVRMDRLLSDLNARAYQSYGFDEKRIRLAKKILEEQEKAIMAGFPVAKMHFIADRIEEMNRYLTSAEKRKISKEVKADNHTSEEHDLCTACLCDF